MLRKAGRLGDDDHKQAGHPGSCLIFVTFITYVEICGGKKSQTSQVAALRSEQANQNEENAKR